MIQQRSLPVRIIQEPSRRDRDHEYMKAPNEPKKHKTLEVTKCCLGNEVSDRWNHCAKINYVYDSVVHGALTTFSVGTFYQTWHKTQNPWLIHMAHIHSNANSRGDWELVARHIVGINAGLGWWHIAHQAYGISLLMRPLCLAAARNQYFQ